MKSIICNLYYLHIQFSNLIYSAFQLHFIHFLILRLILQESTGPAFQYWFIAILMAIGGAFSIFLPETLGLPLPQTFHDSENLGKDRPFFGLIHHWNLKKYQVVNKSSEESDKSENK